MTVSPTARGDPVRLDGGGAGHPTNMDYSPTRWPESPRVVVRCAARAFNGPNHLGLRALQAELAGAKAGFKFKQVRSLR